MLKSFSPSPIPSKMPKKDITSLDGNSLKNHDSMNDALLTHWLGHRNKI
jgi:hypothetical protein